MKFATDEALFPTYQTALRQRNWELASRLYPLLDEPPLIAGDLFVSIWNGVKLTDHWGVIFFLSPRNCDRQPCFFKGREDDRDLAIHLWGTLCAALEFNNSKVHSLLIHLLDEPGADSIIRPALHIFHYLRDETFPDQDILAYLHEYFDGNPARCDV